MKSFYRNGLIILNFFLIFANEISGHETTSATAAQSDSKLTEDLDYTKDFISQLNPEGLNILNKLSCGNPEADHVTEGNETDVGEFPWMALLKYDVEADEYKCGGSLISNRYVLTAAHCVNSEHYRVVGVRLGEHDLSTNPDCREGVCSPVVEDFGIDKIFIHPNYNARKRISNIALIKLDRIVEFKKHIKPICLPITKQSFETSSKNFTIAGWNTAQRSKSLVLLKAPALEQERSACQEYLTGRVELTQQHICTGNLGAGSDTCIGDGGGPLVSFNLYTDVKRFIQYGILAAGTSGCTIELYTNVLTLMPWITSNIVD